MAFENGRQEEGTYATVLAQVPGGACLTCRCATHPTCNVCVLLQRTELSDGREHVNELVEPLCKEFKFEENCAFVHLKGLPSGWAGHGGGSCVVLVDPHSCTLTKNQLHNCSHQHTHLHAQTCC